MTDFAKLRKEMVAWQIHARGVRDHHVLDAMGRVPREHFVPSKWRDQAYEDGPLPIAEGEVIQQPCRVAFMVEALALSGGERVLEIGAGSGYTAAVLAEIAGEVYCIEPDVLLAERAAIALLDAGYDNVHILHDDDLRGWQEQAPFDAILVSAATGEVSETLKSQLAHGGRMVVVVGAHKTAQELVRITRRDKGQFDREDLADVRTVRPIKALDDDRGVPVARPTQTPPRAIAPLPGLILRHAQVFDSVETADLTPLINRVGDKRVVLIGEASHGTSEFYRMRARITQELIEKKGFTIVAAEADWPDAAHIDTYVRHRKVPPSEWEAFSRFPTWMWRNEETRSFVNWLHHHNAKKQDAAKAGFYGLDLYSLHTSTMAILDYLDDVDSELAVIARQRYGCLSPWQADPAAYGHAAITGAYRDCEQDVTRMLVDLMKKRAEYSGVEDGIRFLDAAQNAALVVDAERYYRIMYYGSRASWNLRDGHMFETLMNVMQHVGADAKAVVWAHNSHIGDARATEMSQRGEENLGEMCARGFGQDSYRIGFGTDHGQVAAASDWGGPMEIKQVRPSHRQSYEYQFHQTGARGLILPLRAGQELDVVTELAEPRLERAIGVIYRPETELVSHYFKAELPRQFNEYIWIDETSAVSPLPTRRQSGFPDTYPFGV